MNIVESGIILQNIALGFLTIVIGSYILAALLEGISAIFKIHISIIDFFEYLIDKFNYFINKYSGEMILTRLVGKIYPVFIEIILWVIPIACAVTAGFLLKGFHWGLLGIVAGILLDMIILVPVVFLLNFSSSLKKIIKIPHKV